MSLQIEDPVVTARREADRINGNPERFLDGPVQRMLGDCSFVDPDSFLAGVEAFHAERMAKVPSAERYPESVPWVDAALAVDRELQRLTGMSDRQLALYRSLGDYATFRGFGLARPSQAEKCRVVYLPETDRGAFHVKNIDDPITFYTPSPDPPPRPNFDRLVWDGVGAGLHMDDEPDEIFPLPVRDGMCPAYCDDVPGAVEFLTRYKSFWGGQNIVLHDAQKRSVAIEKTSRNFIDVYGPDPSGGSHCSGMACREPKTDQGRYVDDKRRQYLARFGQAKDGPDMTFWNACDRAEAMLGELMARPGVTVQEVLTLLTTPWPDGLNKCGGKLHPAQATGEYTLVTHAQLPDVPQALRWQRSRDGVYPDRPEVVNFRRSPT